jgi:hypothetical protein
MIEAMPNRWSLLSLALLSITSSAVAQPLFVAPVKPDQIRVDGELGEWRNARWGKSGEAGGALHYALGYDAQALYIAARVQDDSFVRSGKPSDGEDAIVLALRAPRADRSSQSMELWLFAGIPGKQASTARARSLDDKRGALGTVEGITIIEGPLQGEPGYVMEARVPWSSLHGSAELPIGRGALRLNDVDGKPRRGPVAQTDLDALPELRFEGGPNAALAAFVREKGLAPDSARAELFGNVMGDARLERVLVTGTYVLIATAELKPSGASGFRYIDLPAAMGSSVEGAELSDVSGDGMPEIVVTLREGEASVRRAFRWDGARFVRHALPEDAAAAERDQPAQVRSAAPIHAVPVAEHSVVYDKPPGVDELIAEFRRERGVPASVRPRFVTHVNVAEGKEIESLMLFDRELLVLGKGFQGGTGFFYFALPVGSGADIQRMFTGDVTGDGRREVFVRVKQMIGDVQRELLLGYTFDENGMQPILATEVRRAQGAQSVGNLVRLVRAGRAWTLRIEPGVARGYTQASYPFVSEQTDQYVPLLLPWLHKARAFRFEGGQLVARD